MIVLVQAKPTLIEQFTEDVRWLARWVADVIVALLTHPQAGKHTRRDIQWPVGATEESVAELGDIRQALTDTDQFSAVEDVTETWFTSLRGDLAETSSFDLDDYLDAWPAMPPMLVDATEVALRAATRQAGGA